MTRHARELTYGSQAKHNQQKQETTVRSEHMVVFGCDRHTHRRSSLLSPHLKTHTAQAEARRGAAPPAQVRGERASRWLHAPTTRTVCFERCASSAGGPAERRPLVNARNSPRGCRVTASRLQGRKRLFGGKLHNQQVGEEAALRRSTMTPTRRRVVGASGKGAMLNSTRAVAPARAAGSRWTAQCLGGPTTSLRLS